MDKKLKIKWLVNVVLLVFSLLTLVFAVVAWFSNNQHADVQDLHLTVERTQLDLTNTVTWIDVPCATKVWDPETTKDAFNTYCAVKKEYIIGGEGQLSVDVDCSASQGLLGLVFDDDTAAKYTQNGTTDYYNMIKDNIRSVSSNYSYTDFASLKSVVNTYNSQHRFGTTVDGDTKLYVVYWAEYDGMPQDFRDDLYTDTDSSYWESSGWKATLTFVA